jgi:hypothetical protein
VEDHDGRLAPGNDDVADLDIIIRAGQALFVPFSDPTQPVSTAIETPWGHLRFLTYKEERAVKTPELFTDVP